MDSDFVQISRIITLTSDTCSKKILKRASVLPCCVLSPTPSPSPLLNFCFHTQHLFSWLISGSIPLRPPSPIISQRHRSTELLSTDSSTSSPASCFPLPVMSFRSRRVKRRREQDRSLRLVAEGAGHHLFLYLHCLLLGGEGGRRG